MIRIQDATPEAVELFRNLIIERDERIERDIAAIVEDVRVRGDRAVREYTLRFDKADIENPAIPPEEIEAARRAVDPDLLASLERAARNIEDYHKRQVREGFTVTERAGVVLGQRILPLERVGIYVPGGTARYPSSLLMNAIPAKLAGVREIVLATPPDPDGSVPAAVLAAASIAGVTRFFKMGGAQAISALAYGTETIPRVDKIVGPGSIFVTTAKRMVYGQVDIDMTAGPSEILIIADSGAKPRYIAADMLGQAEHDTLASAFLLTDCAELARAVQMEVERQLPALSRAEIARTSIENGGCILLTRDIAQAVDIANELAPEHLELCVTDPFAWLGAVKNAGSVFLGNYAPEALGDYLAGPNHTLPTGGAARYASPMSVDEFVKKSSFIYYTKDALCSVKDDIARIARSEGLTAHANSALIRFEDSGDE